MKMSKSKHRNTHCKEAGKYTYPSEAAASRTLNKYEDIKRTYLCKGCGGWHITSMTMRTAVKYGIVNKLPKKSKKGYPTSKIQNRLDFLNKKINKDA